MPTPLSISFWMRFQVVFLDDRVAAAAVHEEDDRAGTFEDRLVLGPAPGTNTGSTPGTSPRHFASSLQPALNS